jgi:hypothetical protein
VKSFTDYLIEQEVVATARSNMIHFQDMKPVEFINFLREIRDTMGGKLQALKTVMKVDGLAFRFGRNNEGKIFVEGARTGPLYQDKAFSDYAKLNSIDPDIIARAEHYDDMMSLFKNQSFMGVVPPNRKVVCEVFYNPMATQTETGITFVTIEYDKSKLGSIMSILPYGVYEASSGEVAPDEATILAALYKKSNSDIAIINPQLKMGTVDVNAFLDPVLALGPNALNVLVSRKAIDSEAKQLILSVVNTAKDKLADYLLKHPEIFGKFRLGPNIEGIVLHIRGKVYKITTPEFKSEIAAKKAAYNATR